MRSPLFHTRMDELHREQRRANLRTPLVPRSLSETDDVAKELEAKDRRRKCKNVILALLVIAD